MSTLTSNFQFILPAVNNAIDANIWGGQLNTDWTNNDAFLYAINNGNLGTTAPTIPATAAPTSGMTWINSTANPWIVQIYDGTNWVTTGTINTVDHIYSTVGTLAVNVQAFLTAGSFTYTPSVGMSYCIVEAVGGGGGSGGVTTGNPGAAAAGGGGGGGYARQIYSIAQIGASQAVVVGAAGAPASNGGATLFGTAGALLNVTGGLGAPTVAGTASVNVKGSIGGLGGTSSGSLGFLNIVGTSGGNGIASAGAFAFGGAGGSSFFGGGGNGYSTTTATAQGLGLTGGAPGAGAGGTASLFVTGGGAGVAGAAGGIIITEYI